MTRQDETIRIEGMSCTHCVAAVRKALADLPEVEVIEVGLGIARVTFDPEKTSRSDLRDAIVEAGYEPVGSD